MGDYYNHNNDDSDRRPGQYGNQYRNQAGDMRDAAFNDIFGARSLTAASQQEMSRFNDRTRTMSSANPQLRSGRSQQGVYMDGIPQQQRPLGVPGQPPYNVMRNVSAGTAPAGGRPPWQGGLAPNRELDPSRRILPQGVYGGDRAQSLKSSYPYNGSPAGGWIGPPAIQHPPNSNYLPNGGPRGPFETGPAKTAQGRTVPGRAPGRAPVGAELPSGRVAPNPNQWNYTPYQHQHQQQQVVYPIRDARTTSITSSISGGGDNSGRTMSMASMASTIAPTMTPSFVETDASTLAHRPRSIDSERPPTARIREPAVYPALLSRVAVYFRRKIQPGDRVKNELTYRHAFSGQEAVDVLAYCIRTTDRNLALLLGRALDAQKFFHDVTYEHRLRDSPVEIYEFSETLAEDEDDEMMSSSSSSGARTTTMTTMTTGTRMLKPAVNGVFVLLSECYSPTCTRDQLCYSIACPRRLEQVSRLNLKPQPGLRSDAAVIIGGDDVEQTDEQKLWINSVPKEIADSVSDREQKRQEIISEICYTERDFVKDLEYLRDFWINPLRSNKSPIPAQRRDKVTKTIFTNIIDQPSIHAVSSRFAKALTERQQKEPVVRNLGDIFLEFVPHFQPFIHYGSKQLEGKSSFEAERSTNPSFAKFVDDIERRKESRKLELNGYLTKPTTRLARYPLLLENVLKYTEEGNPDREDIPKALVIIRETLAKVNAESGKAENRFNLRRLHEQLRFRQNEKVDLRLTDENRELVHKTVLKKTPTESGDITAFLFDHAVLLVRIKLVGKAEEHKAYKRPIPLELLMVPQMEEVVPNASTRRTPSSLIPLRNHGDTKKANEWPITFKHLGRNGYELTLYAPSQPVRKKWLEAVDGQQQRIRARADFFTTSVLSSGFFTSSNRVNCVVPFDAGRRLLYGTDNGLFVSDRKAKDQKPRRVLETSNTTQVDILEEYGLLLVLANKSLVSYPLSTLEQAEGSMSGRPKKIQNHCSYFRTGICLGRHLVACGLRHAMSTTIKVFEPNDAMISHKKQKGIGRFISAGQDELKPFKEFNIPTELWSVHFLKSKLCVACSRGFEVVSLETLETQSLLDQADTSLDFVARKESVRPLHIERLNGEFLLSYSDFSFFVNRNGWRARPEWRIDWEGIPHAFALSFPWILGFDSSFIELRNIDTGAVHILPHTNVRMLHTSSHEILYAYEDEKGDDVVEAIDFWTAKNHRKSEMPAAPSPSQMAGVFAPPPVPR